MNMLSPDKTVMQRYISGEATPDEAALVDQWRHASPENKDAFDALWRLWQPGEGDQGGYVRPEVGEDWKKVGARMGQARPVSRLKMARGVMLRWRLAAAVVLAGVVVIGLVYFFNTGHAAQMVMRYSGEKVWRDSVPGGVSITLDAFGIMGYPRGGDERDSVVLINGRAYICTTLKPVTVSVGGLVVYANSCDFLLSKDTASGAVSISVFRGLLEVVENARRLVIREGHRLLFHTDTKQFTEQQAVDVNDISFATGQYFFENASLKKVMDVLGRDYRVTIRFTNPSLENCHISGRWVRKINIRELIEALSFVFRIEYKVLQHGKLYELSGSGCED